jgi:hypothetical protein
MSFLSKTIAKLGAFKALDGVTVLGLLGVNNSLAYKTHEIEKHLHNSEFWFGNDGDSTMSRANNLTPFRLTANASANTYGTEVQLSAANDFNTDIEGQTAAVKIDVHKISVVESSINDKNYMIQFWSGTGTFGESTFRTEVPYRTGGNSAEAQPIDVICPRFAVGEKIWARAKCETGGATIDILPGIHGYIG